MTCISSFPVPVADLDKDETGETRRLYEKWKKLNINYLKQMYGDQLKTIIEHTDEEYPHIHAYMLPDQDPDAMAVKLHPGEVAKDEAAKLAKENGVDSKAINRVGNTAYKAVMRKWQDDFYEFVGAPCGLTRDGPKRARETRSQWKKRKATADITAQVIEKNEVDREDNEEAARSIVAETRSLRSQSDVLDKAEDGIEAERAQLVADRRDLELREEQLKASQRSVTELANMIVTCGKMICVAVGAKAKDGILDLLDQIKEIADKISVPENDDPSI